VSSQCHLSVLAHPPGDQPLPSGTAWHTFPLIVRLTCERVWPHTGLEILGEFPGELRGAFMFTAVLVAASNQEAPAKSLVDFLRKPESVEAIRAKGMTPAN
jgi:hypothetical protein